MCAIDEVISVAPLEGFLELDVSVRSAHMRELAGQVDLGLIGCQAVLRFEAESGSGHRQFSASSDAVASSRHCVVTHLGDPPAVIDSRGQLPNAIAFGGADQLSRGWLCRAIGPK